MHRLGLPNAVHTGHGLQVCLRVPVCRRQVEVSALLGQSALWSGWGDASQA
jgi:hypothetical protein